MKLINHCGMPVWVLKCSTVRRGNGRKIVRNVEVKDLFWHGISGLASGSHVVWVGWWRHGNGAWWQWLARGDIVIRGGEGVGRSAEHTVVWVEVAVVDCIGDLERGMGGEKSGRDPELYGVGRVRSNDPKGDAGAGVARGLVAGLVWLAAGSGRVWSVRFVGHVGQVARLDRGRQI